MVQETYDTALACNSFFSKSNSIIADIGIGVIGLPQYYELQKKIVKHYMESEQKWKMFVNGSINDYNTGCSILNELGIHPDEFDNYIYERPRDAKELVKCVTSFDKVISFRMHSQIIASAYGIPSYGFAWDNKVRELYCKLGLPMSCGNPNDDVNWNSVEIAFSIDSSVLKNKANSAGKMSIKSLTEQIQKWRQSYDP